MGKEKSKGGVPNKHLHARIRYLEQAATYLTNQAHPHQQPPGELSTTSNSRPAETVQASTNTNPDQSNDTTSKGMSENMEPTSISAPARLTSHLTHIARRSQIRLQPSTKHTICKRCSALLIEAKTSTRFVENLAKRTEEYSEGKPWAEVLVVECDVCGARKRWPVGARRQLRKGMRGMKAGDEVNRVGDGEDEGWNGEADVGEILGRNSVVT